MWHSASAISRCSSRTTLSILVCWFFFFNDTATTEIYTLSLHVALPISWRASSPVAPSTDRVVRRVGDDGDRKSTRLNSSHLGISYAVFCLKKKNAQRGGAAPQRHGLGPVGPRAAGALPVHQAQVIQIGWLVQCRRLRIPLARLFFF